MQLEVGMILEGKITKVMKFGAFVGFEGGKSGLIHISEISNDFVKEVGDYLKEGEIVKVKVIGISENGKIELSKKRVPSESLDTSNNTVHSHSESFRKAPAATSSRFEEMIMKFKKLSDEKLAGFKKTESRRARTSHRGGLEG